MNTSVATTANTAVAAVTTALPANYKSFQECENFIPLEEVKLFFRPAPGLVGASGQVKHTGRGELLGKKVRIRPESINMRWMVAPGSTDKEAKQLVRNSFDKVNIEDDETQCTVQEYMDALRAKGYDKVNLVQYVDLWAYLTWSEKTGDVPLVEQELVRVQLSQTSASAFAYYCATRGRLERSGLVPKAAEIEIHAEARSGNSGDFTNFSFHAPT